MKIVIISLNNPNVYPGLYFLAKSFQDKGADVYFVSNHEPKGVDPERSIRWVPIPALNRVMSRIPAVRGNYHGIFGVIRKLKPDWVVAQHEYIVPALVYKVMSRSKVTVAGYFTDYHRGRWYTEVLKRMAPLMDIYLDVCDIWEGWRRNDWPRLSARHFILRHAPFLRAEAVHISHQGPVRIIFTGSRYMLGLDLDRLSRFLTRLCERGITVDWFLMGSEEVRAKAQALSAHPGFRVREPIEKVQLMQTLAEYDVGLHWAPMAEKDHDPTYFPSAASNKIGEYISAGLVVAHAGNPGLSFLPPSVCVVFDPTNPEAGAEQLAAALADRSTVERKREAAIAFHRSELNFDAQAEPFVSYALETSAPSASAHERSGMMSTLN